MSRQRAAMKWKKVGSPTEAGRLEFKLQHVQPLALRPAYLRQRPPEFEIENLIFQKGKREALEILLSISETLY